MVAGFIWLEGTFLSTKENWDILFRVSGNKKPESSFGLFEN